MKKAQFYNCAYFIIPTIKGKVKNFMDNNLLKIGEITKPQGIFGEVKVRAYLDDADFFYDFKEIYVGDKLYKKVKARVVGDDVFLCFFGVGDRNSAELLRGKELFVTREHFSEFIDNDDGYFIVDLIGAKIFLDGNEEIGVVTDITQANVDIFTVVKNNGKVLRFPFLKDLVVSVDVDGKIINLNKKRFSEVACYED